MKLYHPIGIFDAGIGSYALVEKVRTRFPRQDIIYFADRANFPYGSKSPEALLESVRMATLYLQNEGSVAVILASNAPSMIVLESLRALISIPIVGVFPPIRDAMMHSKNKKIAVLGVHSMITSEAMRAFANKNSNFDSQVLLVNASSLVALVEKFTFITDPVRTQYLVADFIANILSSDSGIDVMTLSSTHLPWLKPFFAAVAPDVLFLDPADAVLTQIDSYTSNGGGRIRCIATETAEFPMSDLNLALQALGSELRAVGKT